MFEVYMNVDNLNYMKYLKTNPITWYI